MFPEISFSLVALPSSWASVSSLFCWLMGKKRVEKTHLLFNCFVLEEVHATSTHIQLVRTSHMTPPRCKGCWNMKSLDEQILSSSNSALCKGRTNLWWSASLYGTIYISQWASHSLPHFLSNLSSLQCALSRGLHALKKFCQLKQKCWVLQPDRLTMGTLRFINHKAEWVHHLKNEEEGLPKPNS